MSVLVAVLATAVAGPLAGEQTKLATVRLPADEQQVVILPGLLAEEQQNVTAAEGLLVDRQQISTNYSGVKEFMGDMQWPGPERGCVAAPAAHVEELLLECTLPAGEMTLAAHWEGDYLKITCEKEDGKAPGRFSCAELEQEVGEKMRQHVSAQSVKEGGGGRALGRLMVSGCALAEPLRCLLALAGANATKALQLQDVPWPLNEELLQGLGNVTYLHLTMPANETTLPKGALAALPGLIRLTVMSGALRLREGGEGWAMLPRLRQLELVDGGLRELPPRAFLELTALRSLALWGNRIVTVHEDAFKGLENLEILNLNYNRLEVMPKGALEPLQQLRRLQLYDNRMKSLPRLQSLKQLKEVWVNNKNKSTLMLDNDTFADLPALSKLQLESCGITALPGGLLRGCLALAELLLSGNRLVQLPPDLLVQNATALETLNLSHNLIEHLPPKAFNGLSKLKKLDLSHNNLTVLHPLLFHGQSSVQELSLAHNALTLATRSADGRAYSPLHVLVGLQRLSLAYNKLRRFLPEWTELQRIKLLDLSHNNITRITENDLQMISEATVDLRHNQLTTVTVKMSRNMLKAAGGMIIARFLLDENPFRCDCFMYSFLSILDLVKDNFDLDRARCAAPPTMAGTPLANARLGALQCALLAPHCPASCTCALRPANTSLELECSAVPRALQQLAEETNSAVQLRLRAPPVDVAALPRAVRVLDLSRLGLAMPPVARGACHDRKVDLSGNHLIAAPLALLDANCTVALAGNPLACDCAHAAGLAALLRAGERVVDRAALRCADGRQVVALELATLCAGREALALGLGSGLAVAILVLFLFRYRTEVRLLLGRCAWFDFMLPKRDAAMLEKKYDLFVSFSHCDDAYVRGVLVPALEAGRRPLRLCLHYRDWEVGGYIPDQIHRSVAQSWRTIVVLSEDFVRSVWGRHEFRAAHGLERVIVLVLGDALDAMEHDPELRAYKRSHTCIMASHPLVWDHIRDAVYRSRRAPPPAPSAPPAPAAPAALAPVKEPGALDVHLRDGKLVNEAKLKPTDPPVRTSFHCCYVTFPS